MIVQAFMHTSCYGGKAWFELNNFVAETNLCVLIQHGPYNGQAFLFAYRSLKIFHETSTSSLKGVRRAWNYIHVIL